jgi:ribosomal protein L7/L12
MELRLTRQQLCDLLSQHFNIKVENIIIISPPKPKSTGPLTAAVQDNFRSRVNLLECCLARKLGVLQVDLPHTIACRKIDAIHALREFMPPMGLADAKEAMDNWPEWTKKVRECGHPYLPPL